MKNNIELSEVLNALSNFDEFFRPSTEINEKETSFTIPTNIKKVESGYEVEMKVPGYEKDNVSAEMIDTKHLKVVVQAEQEEKDPNHHREFYRNEYLERIVTLDSDVDKENIKASLDKGILTLSLPLTKKPETQKIMID